MDLLKYLHGPQKDLPNTLAARLSFLRNERRLHIAELALLAKVDVKMLEELEAGIETWLPTSVRQRIARVLKVDPIILEEVEKKYESYEGNKKIPYELIEKLQEQILNKEKEINCPLCSSLLRAWIQEGFDINGNPSIAAKAHCTSCLFQLRT